MRPSTGTIRSPAWPASRPPATRCPQAALDSIRRTRLALKGPLETPSGGGYRSSNVRLREEFKLYANLRPARTIVPGGRFDNIDLVVVRENLEGLYIGHEHYVQIDDDPHAVAMATGINTRAGCRHILEFAFEHAIATGRKKVIDRAQGQHHEGADRHLQGNRPSRCTSEKYKGRFELDTVIVDACAMKLVLNPWQFDVLVTTNLFGDILSDLVLGPDRRAGHGAGREHRRGRRHLRGRARLGAGHRRQGHGQPDRAAAGRGDDARALQAWATWRRVCARPSTTR